MGERCSVCKHPRVEEINKDILSHNLYYHEIIEKYSDSLNDDVTRLTEDMLKYHTRIHLKDKRRVRHSTESKTIRFGEALSNANMIAGIKAQFDRDHPAEDEFTRIDRNLKAPNVDHTRSPDDMLVVKTRGCGMISNSLKPLVDKGSFIDSEGSVVTVTGKSVECRTTIDDAILEHKLEIVRLQHKKDLGETYA